MIWALKTKAPKAMEFEGHGLWNLEVKSSEILMKQALQSKVMNVRSGR